MDEGIAYALIDDQLRKLRQLTYSELVNLIGKIETKCIAGEDGRSYQLEIQAFWDGRKGGDVRVIVAADDGGWRAFKPLTGDFIMSPDGSFVGESFDGY